MARTHVKAVCDMKFGFTTPARACTKKPIRVRVCAAAPLYSTTFVCVKDKWMSPRERNLYATSLRACACGPCTYLVRGRRLFLEGAAEAAALASNHGASFDDNVLEEDVQE